MRLCIFTNHFYPEDFKVNDIAFELAKKGYEITVITAIPDYPQGKFYKGYSLFKRRKEAINGVKVIRLPIIPRGKGGKAALVLNYLSYFASAMLFVFFHAAANRYDAVFVHLTSPFFIALPAVFLKRKQHIPLIFWVLDLWPESLQAAGGINNRFILNTQIKFVQYVYDNCDKILIGSDGFRKSICGKGNYHDKIVHFPNWAEAVTPPKDASVYRNIEPFAHFTADDFIVLFAGNMGKAQNLDSVLDAASELKENQNIKFVFLGDGRQKEKLTEKTKELELSKTVFFPGHYPLNTMPIFMEMAHLLLVSLSDELLFNITVPSKIQFYMSQGKPIIAMLNGEGAELINKAKCGASVPAGNSLMLSKTINDFYNMPKEKLNIMGCSGREYYDKHFQKNDRIEQLEFILKQHI